MAQYVKFSPCGDLWVPTPPRTHISDSSWVWWRPLKTQHEKVETRASSELTSQPASPVWQVPGHWETLSHKTRWIVPEELHLRLSFWPPQACAHTHAYTCTYVHSHTKMHNNLLVLMFYFLLSLQWRELSYPQEPVTHACHGHPTPSLTLLTSSEL